MEAASDLELEFGVAPTLLSHSGANRLVQRLRHGSGGRDEVGLEGVHELRLTTERRTLQPRGEARRCLVTQGVGPLISQERGQRLARPDLQGRLADLPLFTGAG